MSKCASLRDILDIFHWDTDWVSPVALSYVRQNQSADQYIHIEPYNVLERSTMYTLVTNNWKNQKYTVICQIGPALLDICINHYHREANSNQLRVSCNDDESISVIYIANYRQQWYSVLFGP